MGETRDNEAYEEELLDYEEEEEKALDSVTAKVNGEATKKWVIFFLFFRFHFFYSNVSILCNGVNFPLVGEKKKKFWIKENFFSE